MIAALSPAGFRQRLDGLADLLADVVDAGASVGFLAPLARSAAREWWAGLVPEVERGGALVWVAEVDGRVVGTVQLRRSPMPNGAHRAELAKLMVHPDARGKGVARALLAAAEAGAVEAGVTLLVLDTEEGSHAEPLYRSAGWVEVGRVPDYAADPGGVLRTTVYFYRRL